MSVPCGNFPSNVIIRPFFLLAFFLVLFLAFTLAAFRSLHASDTQEQTELLLSAPILQAVRSHPQILSQNAKLCQSIYRLGLSRAEQRAQISAKLSGGKVGYAEIAAQQPGVISALHLKTVGAVVQQGTVLAELVPDSTKATIRARLLPQDVADVKVGQTVRISLAAYDVSRYGAVEGVVTRIASNTTQQENMPPFYETLIEIPDLSFPRSPIKPDLVPGMQATIDILGGKRTVMDYILTPIQKASRAAFREK